MTPEEKKGEKSVNDRLRRKEREKRLRQVVARL